MLKLDDAAQHAAWGTYHAGRPSGDTDTKTAFEVGWRAAEAAYTSPAPTDAPKSAFLMFVIDGGRIQWRATYDTRAEAVEEVNHLRPDGTSSLHEVTDPAALAAGMEPDSLTEPAAFTVDDAIEFAFVVESPHFVSFV